LRVLVADDSALFRKAVDTVLKELDGIEIMGMVSNGRRALDYLALKRPDVVLLDVEMPEMDGLATLEAIRLLEIPSGCHRIEVILLSAVSPRSADATVQALQLGAMDFIPKPDGDSPADNLAALREALAPRIRLLQKRLAPNRDKEMVSTTLRTPSTPTLNRTAENSKTPHSKITRNNQGPFKALAIGVSTGGPRALGQLLPALCNRTELPILVVQHMPEGFTQSLAENLARHCSHTVKEAKEGEIILPRHVYIAPGGWHMTVRREDVRRIRLNKHALENGCRPSVNVLFRSLPEAYGSAALACVLTGMGKDGASSLTELHEAGIPVFAQDEASSVVWGMPGAAVATGFVEEVGSIENLSQMIARRIDRIGARARGEF
jgi:two-component system chemotaxis response regulator CheB